MIRRDLTKEKFGRLQPLKIDIDRTTTGKIFWICQCDCGKLKSAAMGNIVNGSVTSCGCYRRKKNWTGHGDISGRYWADCIHGASARDLEFRITIEEAWNLFLQQNRRCAITGRELTFDPQTVRRKRNQTASLDRIDSSKGYTIDNVCWVDRKINYIKGNMHTDDFIKLCAEITRYQNEI